MKHLYILIAAMLMIGLTSCHQEDGLYGDYSDIELTGDQYTEVEENPFVHVSDAPVSTFSIDADGAAYANVRRWILQDRQMPPSGAVRTEEFINYFDLDYPYVDNGHPIDLNGEVSSCPWAPEHKLVRIGIQGKPIPENERPASNFVFLIDVSGSMSAEDKLPLLKNGFKNFVDGLQREDRVAIVTYAGSAEIILDATPGDQKEMIKDAIDQLGAGGGTAGAEGILTAYDIAEANYIPNGNNRIVVGTDGDFNVGPSSSEELEQLVVENRDQGIFLTVLGVGRGNLNDGMLEQIANKGNGTYEYVDHIEQLRKVFIYEYSKFYAVAKDVKVQVEFNPANVESYRLIGYENRMLEEDDFEDDSKDAGEIGADQNITALYEIVPTENPDYKTVETFAIDFRYKLPGGSASIPMTLDIYDEGISFADASDHQQFTAAVASFALLIRESQYRGNTSYNQVLNWLNETNLPDPHGFKSELRRLVEAARNL